MALLPKDPKKRRLALAALVAAGALVLYLLTRGGGGGGSSVATTSPLPADPTTDPTTGALGITDPGLAGADTPVDPGPVPTDPAPIEINVTLPDATTTASADPATTSTTPTGPAAPNTPKPGSGVGADPRASVTNGAAKTGGQVPPRATVTTAKPTSSPGAKMGPTPTHRTGLPSNVPKPKPPTPKPRGGTATPPPGHPAAPKPPPPSPSRKPAPKKPVKHALKGR